VILAGGEGTRLQSLVRFICGDERPKQFCPLLGESTLLEQAGRRAQRSIPAEQTLFAVTRGHENYYLPQLARTVSHRVVQPCNRGTAPPILYSLLQVAQADRDACVAILPSDHYYSDEDAFTRTLESAFDIAVARTGSVVLLGARPTGPEVEYGWIEVGAAVHETLHHVEGFHEKPLPAAAERLLESGALWNTFVMAGHIDAFLQMARSAVPDLLQVLQASRGDSNCIGETRIPDSLYDLVPPSDFSRHVLAPGPERLLTLRLAETDWHDLGNPDRVVSTLLAKDTELPGWVESWQALGKAASSANSLHVTEPKDQMDMEHETILLVDDDSNIRALTRTLLERAGYTVLTAADGEEGLRLFQIHQASIGLLLTDVRMPNMDGRDLADRILQFDPSLPVLLVTGESSPAHEGYECVTKPVKPAELVKRVSEKMHAPNGQGVRKPSAAIAS
jgi:mannose-1-phosphate guanylyltransferase